jgi:hypothetical protein
LALSRDTLPFLIFGCGWLLLAAAGWLALGTWVLCLRCLFSVQIIISLRRVTKHTPFVAKNQHVFYKVHFTF